MNICYALPDVHCVFIGYPRWVLFYLCVCYRSAPQLQPETEMAFVTEEALKCPDSSHAPPMNGIGVMTNLLAVLCISVSVEKKKKAAEAII